MSGIDLHHVTTMFNPKAGMKVKADVWSGPMLEKRNTHIVRLEQRIDKDRFEATLLDVSSGAKRVSVWANEVLPYFEVSFEYRDRQTRWVVRDSIKVFAASGQHIFDQIRSHLAGSGSRVVITNIEHLDWNKP